MSTYITRDKCECGSNQVVYESRYYCVKCKRERKECE
jgi:hypothetical protein